MKKEIVQKIALNNNISTSALVEGGAATCNKNNLFPVQRMADVKDLCNFFNLMERKYQGISRNKI